MSHPDYANSILVGLPKVSIDQLQRGQNIATKIVLGRSKYESSSKFLELHWLTIQYRINFKVVTLVFRCIHRLASSYLEEHIMLKKPSRQGLRSEDLTRQLEIPRTSRHTFPARSFKVKGPKTMESTTRTCQKKSRLLNIQKHLKTLYLKRHLLKLVLKC